MFVKCGQFVQSYAMLNQILHLFECAPIVFIEKNVWVYLYHFFNMLDFVQS